MTRSFGRASYRRVPYRWVIVGAGMLISCLSMGSVFSLAVFLQPLTTDTGWSRTGVSTAMTIDFLAMGVSASSRQRPSCGSSAHP